MPVGTGKPIRGHDRVADPHRSVLVGWLHRIKKRADEGIKVPVSDRDEINRKDGTLDSGIGEPLSM